MEKSALTERRLQDFCALGNYLREADSDPQWRNAVERACAANGFFTPQNIGRAVAQWAGVLNEAALRAWMAPYMDRIPDKPKDIALVMAGNIPLVGFHDYLCVLLCGYSAQVKLSSKDAVLLPFLNARMPSCAEVRFTQESVRDFDAIIATGSGNTFRYFDYYFGRYPHLLRRNRTSVAVLNGNESRADLERLADDIFSYFGLGCRNVSKLYLPKGYEVKELVQAMAPYTQALALNNGYKNNYDYYKSVYLVNGQPHLDTGAALFTKAEGMASPMSVVYYAYYENRENLKKFLDANQEQIQCVVGEGGLPFGSAQQPGLDDWADGENVLDFLVSL
ncbi:MAG: acyl-CoA reductase [Bacteroides sp.]|nr:acyl-CoA reductase [Ruminococcus flavefaciens]MCM1554614.1 acyl-CoA reductase [Bacteroides sp.]